MTLYGSLSAGETRGRREEVGGRREGEMGGGEETEDAPVVM